MDILATGEPRWRLPFDEAGALPAGVGEAFLAEVAARDVTDLVVIAHGWNTSTDAADGLYGDLFRLLREAGGGGPRTGLVGVHWPSLWFPETPAVVASAPGAPQADTGARQRDDAGTAAVSGAAITDAIARGFGDEADRRTLADLGELLDRGATEVMPDAERRSLLEEFHTRLQGLVPTTTASGVEDLGEWDLLLAADPLETYPRVAALFGSAPATAPQGLMDSLRRAFDGAKDVLRVFSYTTMKERAGTVGRGGLGPLLASLHRTSGAVRVHLVGHSFGARLVSFSLAGIPDAASSPVASLLLLQGAFSHWAFSHATGNPFGAPGALHEVADRVHGVRAATFSPFDWAVGRWYPRVSFLAGDDVSAEGPPRWGAMGADGFQAVDPVVDVVLSPDGPLQGAFDAGSFVRVDASAVIDDVAQSSFAGAHSDIREPAVGRLAARLMSPSPVVVP